MIKNTTIQNRSKHAKLSAEHVVPMHHVASPHVIKFLLSLDTSADLKGSILFSIGCHLVEENKNPHLLEFLDQCPYSRLQIDGIPSEAFDLLGSVYQFLNSKTENLELGAFYTGKNVAQDFVQDLCFDKGQIIFDPACGSGAFLLTSNAPADQIYGVDFDPLAIMVAKFNYFIKFPDAGPPQLFCVDFFEWLLSNENCEFDYVIGNPPYGANLSLANVIDTQIVSGESFSYFLEHSLRVLKRDGLLRFLVPEALLNVKRHADIRAFILGQTNLKRIKKYDGKFSGVMSNLFMVELDLDTGPGEVCFEDGDKTIIPTHIFGDLNNKIFVKLSEIDVRILEKAEAVGEFDLTNSIFGLGVVTGDNKTKLFDTMHPGMEHIFTGKEVVKYRLLAPKNFLLFNRDELQQVAPDQIYRAPKKLVYKTISKRLTFALDDSRSLTTNSANILVPRIPGYEVETVMALLNSRLYSYLYMKLVGGVNKVSREGLSLLPFPKLGATQTEELNRLIESQSETGSDEEVQKFIEVELFHLRADEVDYIHRVVSE